MNYTLITPVKDEEENLPQLSECVIKQTKKPKKWIIINDNSNDGTEKIIKSLVAEYEWIDSIDIKSKNERNFFKHFASIIKLGFEKSLEGNDSIEYIIKIDADVRFDEKLFERMIKYMDDNKKVAIASPILISIKTELDVYKADNNINSDNFIRSDIDRFPEPTDGIRIYRKEFLDTINGYPITDASDDIVLALAIMNDYSICFINDLLGYLVRQTGSTMGSKIKHGRFSGYRAYIESFHPLLVFLRVFSQFMNSPIMGIGAFIGYFESFVNKVDKINNADVIEYYSKIRVKILFDNFKIYKY